MSTEEMSRGEADVWAKAAEDLTPSNSLERVTAYNQFIIGSISTVGTLLAGLGGITAAVTVTRSTKEIHGVPIIPVLALLTSVLAGAAVTTALVNRRPATDRVNTLNLYNVRDWFDKQIDLNKQRVRWASGLFIGAACVATVTAAVAGGLALASAFDDPRNLTSVSATTGDKGAVTIHLGGAVDRLHDDQYVVVEVTSGTAKAPILSQQIFPDGDGKVSLAGEAMAPAGSTSATSEVSVFASGEQHASQSYSSTVSYAKVPAQPDPAGGDSGPPGTHPSADVAPAVAFLLGNYLSEHRAEVPPFVTKGIKSVALADWLREQNILRADQKLTPKQEQRLRAIIEWRRAQRDVPTFAQAVGTLFVWTRQHGGIPGSSVVVDKYALGKWVDAQRVRYANGHLDPGRIALLESIPGWTWHRSKD